MIDPSILNPYKGHLCKVKRRGTSTETLGTTVSAFERNIVN